MDQILTLKQVGKKVRENNKRLCITFMDLERRMTG